MCKNRSAAIMDLIDTTNTSESTPKPFSSLVLDIKTATMVQNQGDMFIVTVDEIAVWIQLVSILFSFAGNFLIIFVTFQARQLTINRLVINYLALCDLLYSFVQIFYVHRKLSAHVWHFGPIICALTILSPSSLIASLFIITFIAFERHRSILYPFQTRFGKWRITLFVGGAWVLSLILLCPYLIHIKVITHAGKNDCTCDWNSELRKYWDALVFTLTYPLPIFVFLYCYIRIVARVTRRFDHPVSLRGSINLKHKKLCVTLAAIVIVFVVTTSPNQILILWNAFGDKTKKDAPQTYAILYSLSSCLVHLHSFSNLIIYSFSDDNFRKVLFNVRHSRKLYNTVVVFLNGSTNRRDGRSKYLKSEQQMSEEETVVSPDLIELVHSRHNRPNVGKNLDDQNIAMWRQT